MKSTIRRNATLILGLALLLTLAAFSSAIEPASALGRFFQSTEGTPGVGLRGEYFDNMTLDGSPALTRIDPQVDFSWGEGSPASDIPADQFSVRWTGQVQALFSEDYTFHTLSDDGIRLSLNGQAIIENWAEAEACFERALEQWRNLGNTWNLANTLGEFTYRYLACGRWPQAQACLDEAWGLISERDDAHYASLKRELAERQQELRRLVGSQVT